jgi:hypothetical protein
MKLDCAPGMCAPSPHMGGSEAGVALTWVSVENLIKRTATGSAVVRPPDSQGPT